MVTVELKWKARPDEEKVIRYEIERRPTGPNFAKSRWKRLWNYNLAGGWRQVGFANGNQTEFKDNAAFNFRKRTFSNNAELLSTQSYEYRIRPVNGSGKRGYWRVCLVNAIQTDTYNPTAKSESISNNNPVKVEYDESKKPKDDKSTIENANVTIEIIVPQKNSPKLVRKIGDDTPIEFRGKITGPDSVYDNILAIYNEAEDLVAVYGVFKFGSGKLLHEYIKCSKVYLHESRATGQLPVGSYKLVYFAKNTGTVSIPGSCNKEKLSKDILGMDSFELEIVEDNNTNNAKSSKKLDGNEPKSVNDDKKEGQKQVSGLSPLKNKSRDKPEKKTPKDELKTLQNRKSERLGNQLSLWKKYELSTPETLDTVIFWHNKKTVEFMTLAEEYIDWFEKNIYLDSLPVYRENHLFTVEDREYLRKNISIQREKLSLINSVWSGKVSNELNKPEVKTYMFGKTHAEVFAELSEVVVRINKAIDSTNETITETPINLPTNSSNPQNIGSRAVVKIKIPSGKSFVKEMKAWPGELLDKVKGSNVMVSDKPVEPKKSRFSFKLPFSSISDKSYAKYLSEKANVEAEITRLKAELLRNPSDDGFAKNIKKQEARLYWLSGKIEKYLSQKN